MNEKPPQIQQNDLFIDNKEIEAVADCIDRRWLTEGPIVAQFAEKISAFTDSRFTTFAPNGTLALFLSLLALDLPRGSEIIIPSFTFYASATAAVFAGLKPVFVDVDIETFNMLSAKVEEAITDKTSAIMAVHIYGQSCDIGAICKIAQKRNLKVIEDAAQAFGVKYEGRHVGCIGDIGIFSFFSDKVITTGEGAAIVTNNEKLFLKLKLLRNQGRERSSTFIHPELGMNFRITDFQAAIGLSQFSKFPQILERRLKIWKLYEELLSSNSEIETMKIAPFSNLVPFRYLIKTRYKEELSAFLEQSGIATRSFFYSMHLQPRLQEYRSHQCVNSELLYQQGICLPVHHHLSESDVGYICSKILGFFELNLSKSHDKAGV
jgi:perosamine synthetase